MYGVVMLYFFVLKKQETRMAYYYNLHQSLPNQLTVKVMKLPWGCLPQSLSFDALLFGPEQESRMAYYYNLPQSLPYQLTVKVSRLPRACLVLKNLTFTCDTYFLSIK